MKNNGMVLCVATPDYVEKWGFCIDGQKKYAQKYDYNHLLIDASQFSLSPNWVKFEASIPFLEQGHNILLVDADAEITESCPPFSDLLDEFTDRDIFFSRTGSGRITSGVLILRGGVGSIAIEFIRECLAQRKNHKLLRHGNVSKEKNGYVVVHVFPRFLYKSREIDRSWNYAVPRNTNSAFIRHYLIDDKSKVR